MIPPLRMPAKLHQNQLHFKNIIQSNSFAFEMMVKLFLSWLWPDLHKIWYEGGIRTKVCHIHVCSQVFQSTLMKCGPGVSTGKTINSNYKCHCSHVTGLRHHRYFWRFGANLQSKDTCEMYSIDVHYTGAVMKNLCELGRTPLNTVNTWRTSINID